MKIFYCARPAYGGWVSFTAHLQRSTEWPLYKPGKVNLTNKKFGWGITYGITTDLSGEVLISAIDKQYYNYLPTFPDNSYLVIHDPTELTAQLLPHLSRFRLITIRKSVQEYLLTKGFESRFLYHPFTLQPTTTETKHKAVSISRIDFDKHTELILKANARLPEPIEIYGFVNRLYAHHKLNKHGFQQYYKGTFPKTNHALDTILRDVLYVVDLSKIKNDGGGTQYTFLEAIANDCVLILNRDWLLPDGDFKENVNCLAIDTPTELVEVLTKENAIHELRTEAKKLLDRHLINWKNYLIPEQNASL